MYECNLFLDEFISNESNMCETWSGSEIVIISKQIFKKVKSVLQVDVLVTLEIQTRCLERVTKS